MDSALSKVGLYQFFTVFLSGSIILIAAFFLHLIPVDTPASSDNVVNVIVLLIASYFLGVVLLEISAWIDKKIFRFQDIVKSDFLNATIFTNRKELSDFCRTANHILNKSGTNSAFTNDENQFIFFFCKGRLEISEKDRKVESLNSLCDMSRSLMVGFFLLLIMYI